MAITKQSTSAEIPLNKNISRDLFTNSIYSNNDSSKLKKRSTIIFDKNPMPVQSVVGGDDGNNELKKTSNIDEFGGDLRIRRLQNDYNCSGTPLKISPTIQTSTPSFKSTSGHQSFSHTPASNKSGNSSRNSNSIRSMRSPNDSKSFDGCNAFQDNSMGTARSSHDKSRDRRSLNSTMCLGDFLLTPSASSKQKGRKSISIEKPAQPLATNDKDFPSFTPKGKTNRAILTSTPQQFDTPKAGQSKPMKRVVPTLISSNRNDFNCSAFQSDNNLLEFNHNDSDNTRQLLKMQKDVIRKVFQEEQPTNETNLRTFVQEKFTTKNPLAMEIPAIDLEQITNKLLLDKFIDIYSIILDLNLITNVLNEFSYLVNLINVNTDDYYERNPHMLNNDNIDLATKQINTDNSNKLPSIVNVLNMDAADTLLKNINNCVYFGLGVLKLQKHVLSLLDTTSIKVLLENERLTTLDATIKDDLMIVYTHKMQLESSFHSHNHNSSIKLQSNSSMKVFYQQEQDTQINFPSVREFATFKKQRDTFYSILG